jgi:nucleoside-diphosphate-sugar epimerase
MFHKNAKILITKTSGMVGSRLVDFLEKTSAYLGNQITLLIAKN